MSNGTEVMMTMISMISTMWPPQANVSNGAIYDYIVVGSCAGAVIANRLSQNPNSTVLMIEAGGNPTDDSRIPAQFASFPKTPMDWNFTAVVEPTSVSQEIGKFSISHGKVLGGSSCIGHPIYLRGDKTDFNKWAEKLNDSSWSYENVLPYFKKIENMKDASIIANYGDYHSTEGYMNLTTQPSEMATQYMEAFAEIGHKINPDMNSDDTMGIGLGQYNVDTVRQDVGAAYILSASGRPNYHVLKNAMVTKVAIENNVATGVEVVLEDNSKITIKANKQVIVSAGVVNTPQLLSLSGIGPKEVLEQFKIPVIADLPVGQGLQEHPAVALAFKMDHSSAENSEVLPYRIPFDMALLSASLNGQAPPEYQGTCLLLEHDTVFLQAACSVIFGIKTETCTNFVNESAGRNVMFCLIAKFQPKSRGSVTIQSADPFVYPEIKLNFYNDESDFTDMLSYIKDFLHIQNSTFFKNAEAEVIKPELDCSEDYWSCYAQRHTVNMFHPVGTCAMGSVLDSKGRVKGVDKLRVADSSALVSIPRANNLAATLMLAEKIADDIKQAEQSC